MKHSEDDYSCTQDAVQYFMSRAGQLNTTGFGDFDDEMRVTRRNMLMGEKGEITELLTADIMNDLPEFVDGLIDSIWVLWGTLLKTVGPEAAEDIAREIARANLSKVDDTFGSILWEGEPYESKILKPEGWEPPQIQMILEDHGWEIGAGGRVKNVPPNHAGITRK